MMSVEKMCKVLEYSEGVRALLGLAGERARGVGKVWEGMELPPSPMQPSKQR